MYRPTNSPAAARYRQTMLGSIGLWLVAGSLLLLTGLLPAHSVLLGWSLPFWLVLAPLTLLLALEPGLPRRLLACCGSRRRALRATVWN